MTDALHAAGELLTASEDDRILNYLLLPYGQPGGTSAGRLTAASGAVTIPEDVATLPINEEHEYKRPIGRFVSVTETDRGLEASVRIAKTAAGDDALALAREGLRTGISVELQPYVSRNGELLSATLTGAALCVRPAFADAQLIASDHGELPEEETPEQENATDSLEPVAKVNETPKEENTMSAVPQHLNAAAKPADTETPEVNAQTIARAFATRDNKLAASLTEPTDQALHAALSGTTYSANKANIDPGQWIGELWTGKNYTRKYAGLVNSGVLTSWKVEGFRKKNRITVADWDGDLEEIHSSAATTEPYSVDAKFLAGGFKVSREYVDLGSPEFVDGLYRDAIDDYAEKSDLRVLSVLSNEATVVTGGAVPSGVSETMARVVDGALAMIGFADPTFALISKDLYRDLLLSRKDNSLEYLSSALGFEDGSIGGFRLVCAPELPNDTVIVGNRNAVQFFETGSTPVQVSALDVQHGAIDGAVHGYTAIVVHDERGLVKVV